ncbi:hypothetical protein OROGR_032999 [Orobanche gracilis]
MSSVGFCRKTVFEASQDGADPWEFHWIYVEVDVIRAKETERPFVGIGLATVRRENREYLIVTCKAFGTSGRRSIVKSGYTMIAVADRDLNHYDVILFPEVSSKIVCRMIMS